MQMIPRTNAIDCAGYLNDPVVLDLYPTGFPDLDNSPWARMIAQREAMMNQPTTRYGVN